MNPKIGYVARYSDSTVIEKVLQLGFHAKQHRPTREENPDLNVWVFLCDLGALFKLR